jgi:serine phosphatase RsbU (regulator of sigma subunit)
MKIRDIITGMTGTLCLLLLLAIYSIVIERWHDFDAARRLEQSNLVREQMLLLEQALLTERTRTLRIASLGGGFEDLTSVRASSDRAAENVKLAADALQGLLLVGQIGIALASVETSLDAARENLDASLDGDRRPDEAAVENLIDSISRNLESFRDLRILLSADERTYDAGSQPNALLRYYTSLFADALSQIEIVIARAGDASDTLATRTAVTDRTAAAALALDLMKTQSTQMAAPEIDQQLDIVERLFGQATGFLQQAVLQGETAYLQEWRRNGERVVAEAQQLQAILLEQARLRTATERQAAFRTIVLWLLMLATGAVVFAASILLVRWRIVIPLERLAAAMERLAEDDIETRIPRLRRNDEIGAMNAAVRKFKANAIQRLRLQQNRDSLHGRLKQTYRQLRGDLQAAAKVQHAVLPDAGQVGSLLFTPLFKPSALIAGDSYNVVQANDGRVRFFLIDVAGHGAQAALVSMTAHSLLTEALMASSDRSLTDILANLNRNWPQDLPYLTLVLGDYLPEAHRFELVQAGHPSPVLVSRDGCVRSLGSGGTPIGLVDAVEHDTLSVPSKPGDRLLIYSDGLVEAENSAGEAFGEERVSDLLRRHSQMGTAELVERLEAALRDWRGRRSLEDDVTLLLIEPAGEYR